MTPEPIPPAPRKPVNANAGPRRPSARRDAPGLECSSEFRCQQRQRAAIYSWICLVLKGRHQSRSYGCSGPRVGGGVGHGFGSQNTWIVILSPPSPQICPSPSCCGTQPRGSADAVGATGTATVCSAAFTQPSPPRFPAVVAIDGLVVAIPISDRKRCRRNRGFASDFIAAVILRITTSKAAKTSYTGGSVVGCWLGCRRYLPPQALGNAPAAM